MSTSNWGQLLSNTKVKKLLNPNQKIVTTSYSEFVPHLLKRLSEASVLAAVITTPEKPGIIGFVDVLDILTFVVEVTNESQKDITFQSIKELKWEGQIFSRESSGRLIGKSEAKFHTVHVDTSLLDLAKLFADGVHRVAVMDEDDKRVLNVISQIDLVKFLTRRSVLIDAAMDQPIKDVGLEPLGVGGVLETLDTATVLRYMKENHLSAVPVLSADGHMVSHFSATDLLGLTEESFPLLALNIRRFLIAMHGIEHVKPLVYCSPDDTVQIAVLKMIVFQVHRIYIVDSLKPIGIISFTDVMQFFLARM